MGQWASQSLGNESVKFASTEAVAGCHMSEAHQRVRQGQLTRMIELESGDAFATR